MTSKKHKKNALYFRNFVFGVEDSLVSSVGVLSGIAIANVDRSTIFLTGVVLIFVEAFSMGVGSFLSEESSEGYLHRRMTAFGWRSVKAGLIMFFSYFFAGFIPLFPYIILKTSNALIVSVILALMTLFALGLVAASISQINYLRSAFKMFVMGGAAIGLGLLIGSLMYKL